MGCHLRKTPCLPPGEEVRQAMLPIRWDPMRDLSSLHREMDELFRRTFGSFMHEKETEGEGGRMMTPLVDTFVKGSTYHIKAELPGVSKEDIDLSIDGNALTLKGERKLDKETKQENYYLRETRYGSFVRRFDLPDGANIDDIHASFDNGILEITFPIDKKAIGGRKVLIEGAGSKKTARKVH